MKFLTVAVSVAVLAAASAVAVADPIEEREALMRERNSLFRVLFPIFREQQPFEAAAVLDALEQLNANAQAGTDVEALWPEGTVENSSSSPRVWEDIAAFQAAADRYAADAAAAAEAEPQDLGTFQEVLGPVVQSCNACHEAYRL